MGGANSGLTAASASERDASQVAQALGGVGERVVREVVEWRVLLVDVQLHGLGRGPQDRRQIQFTLPERDRRRVTGCGDTESAVRQRKLGVRSRTQLARRLAGERGEPAPEPGSGDR